MDNLDALLEGYKEAHRKYPEERRALEAAFMKAVVAELKALNGIVMGMLADRRNVEIGDAPMPIKVQIKRGPGRPPKTAATVEAA
jgi:hypothetical protein